MLWSLLVDIAAQRNLPRSSDRGLTSTEIAARLGRPPSEVHEDALHAISAKSGWSHLPEADFSCGLNILHLDLLTVVDSLICFLVIERDFANR